MRDLPERLSAPSSQSAPIPVADQPTLQLLDSGRGDEVILASDYSATTGRTVGAFRDLAPKLEQDRAIWETLPPPLGDEVTMAAEDYVAGWMKGLEQTGCAVYAVLGYCVGCVYAAVLVDHIAQLQRHAPRLILFDPETPSPALLHRHYRDALTIIAKVATAAEIAEAERAGQEAAAAETAMASLATRLCALLIEVGEAAFARAGLGPVRRAELLGTFTSFLHYLVAASELDPLPRWADATALTSVTTTDGANSPVPEQRTSAVAREIHFDVGHADLLRTHAVARTTVDLLR